MITLMHGYDYDIHDYVYSYMCVCVATYQGMQNVERLWSNSSKKW